MCPLCGDPEDLLTWGGLSHSPSREDSGWSPGVGGTEAALSKEKTGQEGPHLRNGKVLTPKHMFCVLHQSEKTWEVAGAWRSVPVLRLAWWDIDSVPQDLCASVSASVKWGCYRAPLHPDRVIFTNHLV